MLDWNDVRFFLAVARTGSMQKAAALLATNPSTVSRRIAALEREAKAPLFSRRTVGADLTDAGRHLLQDAETVADAIAGFQRGLDTAAQVRSVVSLSAPEGLSTYIITPALGTLPRIKLLPQGLPADIELLTVAPGEPVPKPGDHHVRRIGRMRFSVIAGRSWLAENPEPERFSALIGQPLLNHAAYDFFSAFMAWREIAHAAEDGPLLTSPTSSALHRAVVGGAGITLLPDFSPMLDPQVVAVRCGAPDISVDLYLASHPDTLRLPSVRSAFTALGDLFTSAPAFAA